MSPAPLWLTATILAWGYICFALGYLCGWLPA